MRQRNRPGRFSTHKRRADWFRAAGTHPFRELTTDELVRAKRPQQPAAPGPVWENVGPKNIAGRMTSLIAHPEDPNKVLAGAAGGGVWRRDTLDGDWSPVSSGLEAQNVGSLAIDLNSGGNPVAYCGTGEANLSADGHPGAGLFRSEDWGSSWTKVATPSKGRIPGRIGTLAIDPRNPQHLLLGGVGHRNDALDATGGLYRSTDRGQSWESVAAISAAPYWCHSVAFASQAILAAVTERGSKSGIWRSTDGGESWHHATAGLPPPDRFHRTSLAVGPRDSSYVYALVADQYGGVLGVYQSWDDGKEWREVAHGHFRKERNMTYNNAIAVHPEYPESVICGGVDLHLWDGKRWLQVTSWSSTLEAQEYAHADHHCLVAPAGDLVYDCNDGGVAHSTNGGWTWTQVSKGLTTTLFYDLAVDQNEPTAKVMGGGTQDHGALVTFDGPDSFVEVARGDGGWMAFDPRDANRFYSTIYGGRVYRHQGLSKDGGWRTDISPPEDTAVSASLFLSPLIADPSRKGVIYYGTTRVWRSKPEPEEETSWEPISDVLDGSPITVLEIGTRIPESIYAGTENGGVFVSRDRGETWSGDLSSRVLPGALITRIREQPQRPGDPDAPEAVLLCVGRTGHDHVFRSGDGCQTWEPASNGLPDIPFRAICIDPNKPEIAYAGCDTGVFVTRDFGNKWERWGDELPPVIVTDLVIHNDSGHLYAATYGRGIWRTSLT